MTNNLTFIDLEVDPVSGKVMDMGAVKSDGTQYHGGSKATFEAFLDGTEYLCGHNLIRHDSRWISDMIVRTGISEDRWIDTLPVSPLVFPRRPYHALLKDEKLSSDEQNNPLSDAIKAHDLLHDEAMVFQHLESPMQQIYAGLLQSQQDFRGFFQYLGVSVSFSASELSKAIRKRFEHEICTNCDLEVLIERLPVQLAYCLANILVQDRFSILPAWVARSHPDVESVMHHLRGRPCLQGCLFCQQILDPHRGLKRYFGYDAFRTYGGEPLQEQAVEKALQGESLLVVFPTGGGKSITFQIPALIAGETTKGLTVILSPLQSLMKDQVDNLEKAGIHEAVTINGLVDPIERAAAMERVQEGTASILYISPESLRSKTIEHLLLNRRIERFVIDEAHCFSAWGQDFRVDYLYIGTFIRHLQEAKCLPDPIPVSCFTATAKPSVISDIRSYFSEKLGLELKVLQTSAPRTNLHFKVTLRETEEAKYEFLRSLIEAKTVPTIVYVNRVARTEDLANRLTKDGHPALPFHGQMDSRVKSSNQESFIDGNAQIMVATSAFGMGVDKKDVGLVVHFDISNSLENYIQEAGRAGRDEHLEAECHVLYCEEDLDKHFILANQTRLNIKEIQQVWQSVKELTRKRKTISKSALEIARKAGWDESVVQIETRVTTAISALEEAGYLQRRNNSPRVYADSILCRTASEAIERIQGQKDWLEIEKTRAIRIIRMLIGARRRSAALEEDAESRVDYIADRLAMNQEDVIGTLNQMRSAGLLASAKDLMVYISREEKESRSRNLLRSFSEIERFMLDAALEEESTYSIKELNEKAEAQGCSSISISRIRTILRCWHAQKAVDYQYIDKPANRNFILRCRRPIPELRERHDTRCEIAEFILDFLYQRADPSVKPFATDDILVDFSVHELFDAYLASPRLFQRVVQLSDIESTLLYLSLIEAIQIEGGFLVLYNPMTIQRLEEDTRRRYKKEDYARMELFYQNKMQQIHIVGEYARILIRDYQEALQFVEDYFQLNYSSFLDKYFKGNRREEIGRNITPSKFKKLFGELSPTQLKIIKDQESQFIAVLAGPGSGKTRILVHKLASLVLMEDVKYEQLLMLTFSRSAATEFRMRLQKLIGNATRFIEIKTFHSYCFDLMGKVGTLTSADEVIPQAVSRIQNNEIDQKDLAKTVLVLDEAQDMDVNTYGLLTALMERNVDMRVIAVGDDDQNIFAFRGSSSEYLRRFMTEKGATTYELLDNFRSFSNLVNFTNQFVMRIPHRLKGNPIRAVSSANGEIRIVQYTNQPFLAPFVEELMKTERTGTTCVLTWTNDEAFQIVGLLAKTGIPTRLIQSNDEFRLSSLDEFRFLLGILQKDQEGALYDPASWKNARRNLTATFRKSENLENCNLLLDTFEKLYSERIYRTDFDVFLNESKFEDFIGRPEDKILVGTMHKAKGREFDSVHIMLNDYKIKDSESLRLLYVAFTRAKARLVIHYNGSFLAPIHAEGLVVIRDDKAYPPAERLVLQAQHRDLHLDSFLEPYRQKRIEKIQSGDSLQYHDGFCEDRSGTRLFRFSKAFMLQIQTVESLGYKVESVKVRHVIHWKKEGTDETCRIIFPEVDCRLVADPSIPSSIGNRYNRT